MKAALTAAIVAAVVATASAGAALTRSGVHVKRVVGAPTTIGQGDGFAWASCPFGMKAVGGGIIGSPFSATPVQVEGSYPLKHVETWEIAVTNPNSAPATIRAVAVCVG